MKYKYANEYCFQRNKNQTMEQSESSSFKYRVSHIWVRDTRFFLFRRKTENLQMNFKFIDTSGVARGDQRERSTPEIEKIVVEK